MEAKLIKKSENYYELYEVRTNLTLLIGSTDFERKIYVYGKDAHKLLSHKNCQAIERGYDLNELAKEYAKQEFYDWGGEIYEQTFLDTKYLAFKEGFQKALEILSDKKFSEDDMINFAEYCKGDLMKTKDLFNEYQSLQQTEWNVWLVMACGLPDGCTEPEVTCTCDIIPSLDTDGYLILKRK